MAKPKRLSKKILQEDLEAYAALKAISGYAPSNTALTMANITVSHTTMEGSQTDEVQKQGALDAAKDIATDGERAFHNKILGMKTQVKAQFGENSNEYQSLGMKKKEEYKTGRRKAPTNGGTT